MDERRARESAPTAAEQPSPDGLATPSSPSVASDPAIAADADDLRAIKKAVDDAAAVGGGLWLSYLFVLFYLAVAAGAVTHADLFLENPVKLPFLNIELPLLAFFFVAPILFVIVHAYTLVHLVMLTEKAKRFHQVLNVQIPNEKGLTNDELARRAAIRAGLRRQLPSNIFVQFLAGPRDVRESAFGGFLQLIAWITLGVAPLLLLLLLQIQFLPFHNSFITWTHRAALLADLVLLWWLWRKVLSGRWGYTRRPRGLWAWSGVGLALSLGTILFSWGAATFPGEWQEDPWPNLRLFPKSDREGHPIRVSLHNWIFNSKVDPTTRQRWLCFSSTLVLPGFNVYEGLKIDDPDKVKGRDYVFRARGRDLKGAIFDLANLPRVDFEGAQLQDASLNQTQLQDVSLKGAELQGASLNVAKLQGASLDGAHLEGASLQDALLQGASLNVAKLQGASLDGAHLEGASLSGAWLQGASLGFAQLQGAWPFGAQLQAASLDAAQLEGATLDAANFEGASLDYANLQGASLQQARLHATSLSMTFLWRTNRADRIPGAPNPTAPSDVRLPDAPDHWLPIWRDGQGNVHPWNEQFYDELRRAIESLPAGLPRIQALESFRRADCGSSDPALASCDPSIPPPAEAVGWRKSLEGARVGDAAYVKALAVELKALVCSGSDDAVFIVGGAASPLNNRLAAAGPEAPALVDFIMGKDCPVSALLTEADNARLRQIKRDAIKEVGQ